MSNHDEVSVSENDFWPRYYFDLDVAKSEVQRWLMAHKQFASPEMWEYHQGSHDWRVDLIEGLGESDG